MTEALRHAGWAHGRSIVVRWVDSEIADRSRTTPSSWAARPACSCPGGFGHRGIEGKVLAARYARESKVPYLGLCLGLQCGVIEFARDVVGATDANSTEFDLFTNAPVIDFMPDQREMEDKGGTMRLGLYPARLTPGSKAAEAYGEEVIYERHRHRFEVTNEYREALEEARHAALRPVARRPAGRDRRAQGPPVVRGLAVPSRVQEPAGSAASAVRRLRQGGDRARRVAGCAAAKVDVTPDQVAVSVAGES